VLKITAAEYAEFLEHYSWQLLQSPDYRLGQAFLNYFPDVSKVLSSTDGTILEMKLYYETDNARAQKIIDNWRDVD
jgi:hypothetical protein